MAFLTYVAANVGSSMHAWSVTVPDWVVIHEVSGTDIQYNGTIVVYIRKYRLWKLANHNQCLDLSLLPALMISMLDVKLPVILH